MARRGKFTGETLHTSLQGTRSVWLGRKPRGERTTHSFNAFVARARRGRKEVVPGDNQLHLARHHRGYRPPGKEDDNA